MRVITPLLLIGLFACAKGPELEPAPEAAGTGPRAHASVAGVTMSVDPHDWVGMDLDDEPDLVYLNVEVENDSGRSLLLRPDFFMLVAADGRAWKAVDPDRPDMVDLDLNNELFEYGGAERVLDDVEDDMDDDEEDISGDVYFQGLDESLDRVTFTAQLVDARTGERFGTLRIPLVVEREDGEVRVSTR